MRVVRYLVIAPLAIVLFMPLSGCHSEEGNAKPTAEDMQRLPPEARNSNMPDAAKKGLAEYIKRSDPNARK